METNELKVLICDDSTLIREHLKQCLIEIGVRNILQAADGQTAVDLYMQEQPDLVFLDIVMPILNGLDVLHEIREYDPEAYVVMASTVGTKGNLRIALENGAYEFIQKPFDQKRIKNIVDNYLK